MDGLEIVFFIYMVLMTIVIILLHSVQVDIKADISELKKNKVKKQKNQFKIGLYYKINDSTDDAKYITFKTYKDCAKWIEKMVIGSNTIKIVNLYNYYKEG